MKTPIVSVARARIILTHVSRSLLNTTPTAEKPALSEAQRTERLRSLAKRLYSPDGLDRDVLKNVEKLTGEQRP